MRVIGLEDFQNYLSLVADPENRDERRELVSVLTTNVSSFYRESHHFEFFSKNVIPALKSRLQEGKPARIWSAGCSSGQEPYSIAMECLKAIPDAITRDLLILATDIDAGILKKAALGEFSSSELGSIDVAAREQFFDASPDASKFTLSGELRSLVRFRELNLHGDWPIRGLFDAIFCRNVVIYFDAAHQQRLWPRFREAMHTGGFLFLGHSERVHPLDGSGFSNIAITTYRKM